MQPLRSSPCHTIPQGLLKTPLPTGRQACAAFPSSFVISVLRSSMPSGRLHQLAQRVARSCSLFVADSTTLGFQAPCIRAFLISLQKLTSSTGSIPY